MPCRHSGEGRNLVQTRRAKHSTTDVVSFGRVFRLDSGLRRNDGEAHPCFSPDRMERAERAVQLSWQVPVARTACIRIHSCCGCGMKCAAQNAHCFLRCRCGSKKSRHRCVFACISAVIQACVALMLQCDEWRQGAGMNTYAGCGLLGNARPTIRSRRRFRPSAWAPTAPRTSRRRPRRGDYKKYFWGGDT